MTLRQKRFIAGLFLGVLAGALVMFSALQGRLGDLLSLMGTMVLIGLVLGVILWSIQTLFGGEGEQQ